MKKNKEKLSDLAICKIKIETLLKLYNCEIYTDDYHWCFLRDNDTHESVDI